MIRSLRVIAVLVGLAGVALVVVSGVRPWAYVTVPGVGGLDHLPLLGRKALPSVLPIALAAGAGVVVMATAARVIRFGVAAALVAGGVLVGLATHDARQNALSSATKALESTIGMFGQNSQLTLPAGILADGKAELTIWSLIAVGGGALIAASGVLGLLTGARWPDPAQRFETAGDRPLGAIGRPAGAMAPPGTSAGAIPPAADDARTWDALSRGDDPT